MVRGKCWVSVEGSQRVVVVENVCYLSVVYLVCLTCGGKKVKWPLSFFPRGNTFYIFLNLSKGRT